MVAVKVSGHGRTLKKENVKISEAQQFSARWMERLDGEAPVAPKDEETKRLRPETTKEAKAKAKRVAAAAKKAAAEEDLI